MIKKIFSFLCKETEHNVIIIQKKWIKGQGGIGRPTHAALALRQGLAGTHLTNAVTTAPIFRGFRSLQTERTRQSGRVAQHGGVDRFLQHGRQVKQFLQG